MMQCAPDDYPSLADWCMAASEEKSSSVSAATNQDSKIGSARTQPPSPGPSLVLPSTAYCQQCFRTEPVCKSLKVIFCDPNRIIYYRQHAVLECGHPPPAPYDTWEESIIVSCGQTRVRIACTYCNRVVPTKQTNKNLRLRTNTYRVERT